MSSRQEEKEARRQERLEQEARERKSAARSKRLQYVIGAALAAGIVAVVVVLLLSGGGTDGNTGTEKAGTATTASGEEVTLPEPAILNEDEAVSAAGCDLGAVPNEGRGHEEKDFKPSDYEHNPPTSGTHFPTWADDGIYEAGNTPPLGTLVHTLEHGRVNIQYAPGTDETTIAKLEALVGENQGYHMLMYENETDMDAAVAATAWDFSLTCDQVNDKTWDALRTFRDAHLDRAPEKVA